jgi:fibrillarin-like pre-rRNA processing protein
VVAQVAEVKVAVAAVTLKNAIVAVAAIEAVVVDSESVVAVTVEAEVATKEVVALETAAAEEVVDSALKNVAAVVVEVAVLAVDTVVVVAAIGAIDLASRSGDKTVVQIRVKPHPHFTEIYQITLEDGAHRLATKSFAPGRSVYGERLIRFDGVEYRVWDAFRSKLAGAILKGLQIVPILPSHKVLYLGAASGTTPSHVSDIVGENGHVYCVEFAQRSLRELVTNVITYRPNMSPFLADARMPQKYTMFITSKVDNIYCDVATSEQAKVLADNADVMLKAGGWVMLAVKSQSIDVSKAPSEIYRQEARILENRGFRIEQVVDLEPYDKAHAMILAQR